MTDPEESSRPSLLAATCPYARTLPPSEGCLIPGSKPANRSESAKSGLSLKRAYRSLFFSVQPMSAAQCHLKRQLSSAEGSWAQTDGLKSWRAADRSHVSNETDESHTVIIQIIIRSIDRMQVDWLW